MTGQQRYDPHHSPRGLLTDEVLARCVEALRGCSYVKDACAYAGIAERRYHDWVARGYRYEQHIEDGGAVIEGEGIYRHFALEVDQARAEARVSATAELRRAWEAGDWRAAVAYLERSDPQHWGKVNRVEMTGRDGGAIEVDVTDLERRLAESILSRPLVIDAETAVEVAVVPQLAAAAVTEDDDDDDYFLVVPSALDYSAADLWDDAILPGSPASG